MKKLIIPIILILGVLNGGCVRLIQKMWPYAYKQLVSRETIKASNNIQYEIDSFLPSWGINFIKNYHEFKSAKYGYKCIKKEGRPEYGIIFTYEGNEYHPKLKILGVLKHSGKYERINLDIRSLDKNGTCTPLLKANGDILIKKSLGKPYPAHDIEFYLIDQLYVQFEDNGEIITIELKNIDYHLKRGIKFGMGY